jgi:hypothetical protein
MLARLEKDPGAVFYERELLEWFPLEFEQAKGEGLLRGVPANLEGGSYSFGLSRPYTVVTEGDRIEAFDDEDPEADPIPLTMADLVRWSLDMQVLALRFQETNCLRGVPCVLDDRLFFLGEAKMDGQLVAVVLALVSEPRQAGQHLTALPGYLPGVHDRIAAVCPSYLPTQGERRRLESLQVFVVTPDDTDLFKVDVSQVLLQLPRKAPRIVLSDEEEEQFDACGFKSRFPIVITGRRERRTGNVLEVGGARVVLTDAPFKLFLRLVAALHETQDGFLPRGSMLDGGGLVVEGFYTEDGVDQALNRLRAPFGPALRELKPTEFIEVRGGRIRLSTHRRFIAYDRERLLGHSDQMVRDLTERIPSGAQRVLTSGEAG